MLTGYMKRMKSIGLCLVTLEILTGDWSNEWIEGGGGIPRSNKYDSYRIYGLQKETNLNYTQESIKIVGLMYGNYDYDTSGTIHNKNWRRCLLRWHALDIPAVSMEHPASIATKMMTNIIQPDHVHC